MICRPHNQPTVGQDIDAMVCWMTEQSTLAPRHEARRSSTPPARPAAMVKDLHYRLDVNTLHRDEHADDLALNEIGRVSLRTTAAAVLRRVPPQPRRPAASSSSTRPPTPPSAPG